MDPLPGPWFAFLMLALALCAAACRQSHNARKVSADDRAEQRADDLELAFERHFACRDLSGDEPLWKGFSRECFTALIAEHVERQDALALCVSEKIAGYRACGVETPCASSNARSSPSV